MVEVNKVNIFSLAKFLGIAYLLIGLVLAFIAALAMVFGAELPANVAIVELIMGPLLYGVAGWLSGIVFGAVYNFVASKFGGIQFYISDDVTRKDV